MQRASRRSTQLRRSCGSHPLGDFRWGRLAGPRRGTSISGRRRRRAGGFLRLSRRGSHRRCRSRGSARIPRFFSRGCFFGEDGTVALRGLYRSGLGGRASRRTIRRLKLPPAASGLYRRKREWSATLCRRDELALTEQRAPFPLPKHPIQGTDGWRAFFPDRVLTPQRQTFLRSVVDLGLGFPL